MKSLIGLVSMSLLLVACSSGTTEAPAESQRPNNEILITKDTYNGKWALDTDKMIIGCVDEAVYCKVGDVTYSLTGFSQAYSKNKGLNWLPLTPESDIWLPNPEIKGAKIDIGDIIQTGKDICQQKP